MHCGVRATWVTALAVATAWTSAGCKHYVAARSYDVAAKADASSTYKIVRQVLGQKGYVVADEDPSARTVRVRAHADENEAGRASFIRAEVGADGRVTLVPSGSLVRADGGVHSRLSNEMSKLERQIDERLRSDHGKEEGHSAEATDRASAPRPLDVPAGAPPRENGLPRAWSERAYDPKTWGDGEFTCIPVKLPSDTRQLRLKLSNNEDADVSISIAYDPGLCRSGCPLPGGCPALGLGDSKQVAKLAERLDAGQIDSNATVVLEGRAVSTIDLRKHGSIDQSLRQLKHPL
jgi:hypothetical protein